MCSTDPAVVMRLFRYTHDPDSTSSVYAHRLHAYTSFLSILFSLGYMILLLQHVKMKRITKPEEHWGRKPVRHTVAHGDVELLDAIGIENTPLTNAHQSAPCITVS